MRIIGHAIDADGYYLYDVLEGGTPDVTERCPDGLFRAKWDGTEWTEDKPQEEIDELLNPPVTETPEQRAERLEAELAVNTQILADLTQILYERGILPGEEQTEPEPEPTT